MSNNKSTLETERLILRLPIADDFEAFHSWASNPDNTRYMAFGPNDEDQTKAFLEGAKPGRDFAVVLNGLINCGMQFSQRIISVSMQSLVHRDIEASLKIIHDL